MTKEYKKMISGNMYNPAKITGQYASQPGRVLAQKIGQIPLDDQDQIVKLEYDFYKCKFLAKTYKVWYVIIYLKKN